MGPAVRLVAMWSRSVARAEGQLVRAGCAFALLDVVTTSSACFVSVLTPLLGVARLVAVAVLVPAVLRALAMRYANRPVTELMTAIAVAIGVTALYVAARTALVVEVCAL